MAYSKQDAASSDDMDAKMAACMKTGMSMGDCLVKCGGAAKGKSAPTKGGKSAPTKGGKKPPPFTKKTPPFTKKSSS